jgi:putative nucleotidyltransferase with HDIG domain
VNGLVIALTIVLVGVSLTLGRAEAEPAIELSVGDPAPETYTANAFVQVLDEAATETARQRAALQVPATYRIDTLVRSRVEGQIRQFFNDVRNAPLGPDPLIAVTAIARTPVAAEEANRFAMDYTITVNNPRSRERAYELSASPRLSDAVSLEAASVDIDYGADGRVDQQAVPLSVDASPWMLAGETPEGTAAPLLAARASDQYLVSITFVGDATLVTDENSGCTLEAGGVASGLRIDVDAIVLDQVVTATACRPLPALVEIAADTTTPDESTTTSSTTTTTSATTSTTTTTLAPEAQVAALEGEYAVYRDAIPVFVELYAAHLADLADGGDGFFDRIEQTVVDLADDQLQEGIRQADLLNVRNSVLADPPRIVIPELDPDQAAELRDAAATVVALSLDYNEVLDEEATNQARQQARDSVEDQVETYALGQPIVRQGETITAVQLEAINRLGLLEPEPGASRTAVVVLGGLAVLLAALFLWRIAPSQWSQPKHIALLGILMLLAAVVARVPELIGVENPQLAYAMPAAMLGYTAAIMYDPRTALLTSVPMGIFTAVATQDPALTVYAAAATVAPVAFVSAVSTRRELRLAVVLGAAVLVPLAGTVAWMFGGRDLALEAAVAGFAGGVIGGLLAQGLVSFLENLFQITTTVTLLDLTDRNHPALRLIEDKAPGTFNHSILVGNLAGKAARAIGANPLLAQATAFYHDLGKTENPQFFIENQFGVSNPHDDLAPEESAEIIRRHVSDGLRLARQYRIPPDVAAGVEQHHGTGLMRYFYHKAMEADPTVDPALFRHRGRKPQRKEMAIVMISDAVEGAARALAQHEDPTADSLQKLVESIVGEKLEDGQFDESALTFGDLTKVKRALVEALIGYYHTRIPYPGFPGPRVVGS